MSKYLQVDISPKEISESPTQFMIDCWASIWGIPAELIDSSPAIETKPLWMQFREVAEEIGKHE